MTGISTGDNSNTHTVQAPTYAVVVGDSGVRPDLYPDIVQASSLQAALQTEFDRSGYELTALLPASPGWRYVGAVVQNSHRTTNIVLGVQERVFTLEFWAEGVWMASGNTADLPAAAGATHVWQTGALVRQLKTAWPFTRFSPWSEACERGEGIEFTWQQYLTSPQLVALNPFIAAAMDEPRLRTLFPFISMGTLGFRRTVSDTPSAGAWVKPLGDNRYLVRGQGGREVGVADAAGSVRLVLAVLEAAHRPE